MEKILTGKITEIGASNFKVFADNNFYTAKAKGTLKQNFKILLGDNVQLDISDEPLIIDILPRQNQILKPACANINAYMLILSVVPKPNYKLVDLILALCFKQNIKPIICINKIDLSAKELCTKIHKKYDNVCDIYEVSAKEKTNLDSLNKAFLETTAICGQSAVGKSSLINAMFDIKLETGDISEKILRGKNTTVKSYFYKTKDNRFIIDTPGFSFIDINKIELVKDDLFMLYPDFKKFPCKFTNCTHENTEGCNVAKAVLDNKLDKERVENFKELYNSLKTNLKEENKRKIGYDKGSGNYASGTRK